MVIFHLSDVKKMNAFCLYVIVTFDHVIECLVKICEHTYIQAEQCAYIVHYSGKCVVKTGSLEELIPKCTALLEAGLSAEVI